MVSAAVAALCVMPAFTGCQKGVADVESSAGKARLEISIPIAETKVVGGADETAIRNYQVFLFNDQEVLEAYVNKSSSDISMNCTMGNKTVAVLVNAPALDDVTTLSGLMNKQSLLSHNDADAFVMEGKVPVSIETTEDVSVEVPVYRKVSKVELVSVVTAFELPQHREAEFTVSSVYMINVAADARYFATSEPTLWYNKSGYVLADDNRLIYDDMSDLAVTAEAPYSKKNAFYCYPNDPESDSFDAQWCPRNTRLVVETKLDDETYYYPVTLPLLEQNKRYEVSLTITRPGSYVPDTVVDKFAAEFSVLVKDWEEGAPVSEEI